MTITNVSVVGCGKMGLGIVECVAKAGYPVQAIKTTKPESLAKTKEKFYEKLRKQNEQNKLSDSDYKKIVKNVVFYTDIKHTSQSQLVIESIVEDFETKIQLLKKLENAVKKDTIIASNTSSLPLNDLLGCLSSHSSTFIGLHFFNPVHAMKLVEIGTTEKVNADVIKECKNFCNKLNKTPIEVQAKPGYIVNRLLLSYILQSMELLEEGLSSAENIDGAMQLGCGHPMGPLKLADLIGLDVVESMAKYLSYELQDKRYRIPSILKRLVIAGNLGKKTGKGIYDYNSSPITVNSIVVEAFKPE